jgi:FMNH2-dependent dimethyl sulfone monooxygenase
MGVMRTKFGVYVPMYGGWIRSPSLEEEVTYKNAEKAALVAEGIGIHSVWVPDHLLNPIKDQAAPALEAWTTLTAIGAVTERVELFHTTICQGFRYPSVLAKMCVAMQDVSRGRFSLSLGAGWFKREFEAYGLPWEDHDARIDRSREQIEIIKRLWKERVVNHSGKYYTIKDGILEPKPSSDIPLWWGGESEKSRELAADHFDGWLMNSSTSEEVTRKIDDMEERLFKRGRKGMKYAVPGILLIEKTDEIAGEKLRRLLPDNKPAIERIERTGYVGSPETVASRILEKDETGISYIIFQCAPTTPTLEAFKENVLHLL